MSVCVCSFFSFPVLKGFEVETDCECTGSTTVRSLVRSREKTEPMQPPSLLPRLVFEKKRGEEN